MINGAGIAAMPTYVHDVTDRLIPLAVPSMLRRELHLVYHDDARHSPAVRTTIAWLREAFDPAVYPWFADGFVHPHTVPPRAGSAVVGLVEGLGGGPAKAAPAPG